MKFRWRLKRPALAGAGDEWGQDGPKFERAGWCDGVIAKRTWAAWARDARGTTVNLRGIMDAARSAQRGACPIGGERQRDDELSV